MLGRGLYANDSVMFGAGFIGQDVTTLFLGIPLLAISTALYRRGSLRAGLILTGVLAFFLYVYSSMAFGAAYNNLFLVYVALFSASFFAFVLVFTSIDLGSLPAQVLSRLPPRGPAVYLFVAGLLTLVVWLTPIIEGLIQNQPPGLMDSYTTMVTYALDLALITPCTFIAGILMLRGNTVGYKIAFGLIGIIAMLVPTIVAMTISQVSAGIVFGVGEMVGPIAGFAVLGLLAIWVAAAILRRIPDSAGESVPSEGIR